MEMKMDLSNMSADALEALAKKATSLAKDLRRAEPSYSLAIEAGIKDKSYSTYRCGRVSSFSGEAVVTMADGRKWKCIGHGPRGAADYVSRDGFIEFIQMDA